MRGTFQLNQDVDGKPLREHLESLEKQTGRKPPRLADEEKRPPQFDWIIDQWHQLRTGTPSNGMGVSPIPWDTFHAYSMMTGLTFSPMELHLIRLIDLWWLDETAKHLNKKSKRSGNT